MRGSDGFDALGFSGTPGSMRSPDMEMFELSTPHFMEYYEYLPDSAGAGRWRGGLGTTSSWRFYGEGELGVSIGDDAASEGADPAAGLFGGEPAGLNELELHFPDGTMRELGLEGDRARHPRRHRSAWRATAAAAATATRTSARRRRVLAEVRDGLVSVDEGARELRRRRAARPLGHRRGRDRAPARSGAMSYRVGIDVGGTFTDFLVIGSDGAADRAQDELDARRPVGRRRHRARGDRRRARHSIVASFLARTSTRSCTARPSRPTPCSRAAARAPGLLATKGFRDALALRNGLREEPYDNRLQPPRPARPALPAARHRGARRLGGRRGHAALARRRARRLRDASAARASRPSRSRSCTRRPTPSTSAARATSAASCCRRRT